MKLGRPTVPNKKKVESIRLYPAEKAAIRKKYKTVQKWINEVVKQICVDDSESSN